MKLENRGEIGVGALYRHYKGSCYQVVALAYHSETLEEMVVYQALEGEKSVWVRPRAMFEEWVEVDGERKARFALMKKDLV